jgi:hypothetical protein
LNAADLLCPGCGDLLQLRERSSRKAGKLLYSCRACDRTWSFQGGGEDLVDEPGIEESGSRTVRLRPPGLSPEPGAERLTELAPPSETGRVPEGVAVTLEFIDGPQRGSTFPVKRSRSYLGRDPVEIHLEDPLVSRRHAVLEIYDPETIILKDLSSTNGTYCNGRMIDHCKLSDGDEVRVGSSVITVLIDAAR